VASTRRWRWAPAVLVAAAGWVTAWRAVRTDFRPDPVLVTSTLALDVPGASLGSAVTLDTPFLDSAQEVEIVRARDLWMHGQREGEKASPLVASAWTAIPAPGNGARQLTLLDLNTERAPTRHRVVLTAARKNQGDGTTLSLAARPDSCAKALPPAEFELQLASSLLLPHGAPPPTILGSGPAPLALRGRWARDTELRLSLGGDGSGSRVMLSKPIRTGPIAVRAAEPTTFEPSAWASCAASQNQWLDLYGANLSLREISVEGSKLKVELVGVAHCGLRSIGRAFYGELWFWISLALGLLGLNLRDIWRCIRERGADAASAAGDR